MVDNTRRINPNVTPWLCDNCKQVLGVPSEDLLEMRIKHKDSYFFISPDKVLTTCRGCNKVVRLVDKDINDKNWWVCPNCSRSLGHICKDNGVLNLKYKDLYIYSSKDRLETICKRCGQPNVLTVNENPKGREVKENGGTV